jgi:hypothetical protein
MSYRVVHQVFTKNDGMVLVLEPVTSVAGQPVLIGKVVEVNEAPAVSVEPTGNSH